MVFNAIYDQELCFYVVCTTLDPEQSESRSHNYTYIIFRCDSISTFDHVTQSLSHSASLYQNITKKTFITYIATFRNY